ncbi:hypothetical protein ACV3RL_14970 [Clostridium perfringens]
MSKDLFMELESIDIELSRLSLKNLNKQESEYRNYLVAKIERVSKEIMIAGKKRRNFKIRKYFKKLSL